MMAVLVELGIRSDPVLNHNFVVSLIDASGGLASIATSVAKSAVTDVVAGGFSECSGLEMSMEAEEYSVGGGNGAVLKFPSRVKWSNITLKKGVAATSVLWDWHYDYVSGKGKRKNGVITLLNDLHIPNNIWYFEDGLPVRYTGPTLNGSENNVAIESLEIAHHGIFQVGLLRLPQ